MDSVVLEPDPASTTYSSAARRNVGGAVPPPPGRLVSRGAQDSVSIPPRNTAPPGVLVSHRGPERAEPARERAGALPTPAPAQPARAEGASQSSAQGSGQNPTQPDPFITKPAPEHWQPFEDLRPTSPLPELPTRASDATLLSGPPGMGLASARSSSWAEGGVDARAEVTPRGEMAPLASPMEQDEFTRRRRMALLTGFFGGLIPGLMMAAWFSMVDRQIAPPPSAAMPAPLLLVEGAADLRLLLDGQPVEGGIPARLTLEPARPYRLQLLRGEEVTLERTITLELGQQLHWQLLEPSSISQPEAGTPLPPR